MSNLLLTRLSSWLLVLMALTVSQKALSSCDRTFIHAWGGLWEPFVLGKPDNPSGIDMDILNAVMKATGCKWKNTNSAIPWSRHLDAIKSGDIDLATAASWEESRAEYAYFSKPYRSEYVAVFVHKDSLKKYQGMSLEDFLTKANSIGVERGNYYGKEINSLLLSLSSKVETVNDNQQNISKLLSRRLDGYLGYLPYDSIQIKLTGDSKSISYLPLSVRKTGNVHIMLSKEANTPEDFAVIERGLEEIKMNGIYDEIIRKYNDKYGEKYW